MRKRIFYASVFCTLLAIGGFVVSQSYFSYYGMTELSSQKSSAEDEDEDEGVDYDSLPMEARSALDRESGKVDTKGEEAEFEIEKSKSSSNKFITTDRFVDDGEELMRQALR